MPDSPLTPPPPPRISPLARRLVAATIAVSTLIALLATGLQLYLDYRRDLGQIESTFQQVQQTYLPTIASALWATNRKEVQIAVDGIKQLPDTQYVAVVDEQSLWAQSGSKEADAQIVSRDYPIQYQHRDQVQTIGTLHFAINMAGIYERLWQRFWTILITNTIKTFLVAGFMLWLVHLYITRHLRKIAAFAANLAPGNLQQQLTLDRPAKAEPDEFEHVLQGFQRMQSNLHQALNDLRQDIQAREKVEEELRLLNAQLEQRVEERTRTLAEQARIIDEIHDAVLSIDLDGKITSWNHGAERLFGYSAVEVLGKHAGFLFPEMDTVFDTRRIEDEKDTESTIRRKNGEILYAHLSLSALHNALHRRNGYACYAMDITPRKQAEALALRRTQELEASNRELEAFSYSVSHDLRAPLRSIDGFSQALLEDCGAQIDKTGQDYLQRIRRSAQRMGMLIDDLLQLARVTRQEMHQSEIDFSALMQSIATELAEREQRDPNQIEIQPCLKVMGDPDLLRIAMENLLGNALKFTRKCAQPLIEVGMRPEGGRLVYYVRDNGVGFDMAYAGKLFGAFQRLHREEDFPGTGIGLATVKRILHRHGCEVWAESTFGQGAAFYFTLPRVSHLKLQVSKIQANG